MRADSLGSPPEIRGHDRRSRLGVPVADGLDGRAVLLPAVVDRTLNLLDNVGGDATRADRREQLRHAVEW
jgi:hypothetical protein